MSGAYIQEQIRKTRRQSWTRLVVSLGLAVFYAAVLWYLRKTPAGALDRASILRNSRVFTVLMLSTAIFVAYFFVDVVTYLTSRRIGGALVFSIALAVCDLAGLFVALDALYTVLLANGELIRKGEMVLSGGKVLAPYLWMVACMAASGFLRFSAERVQLRRYRRARAEDKETFDRLDRLRESFGGRPKFHA